MRSSSLAHLYYQCLAQYNNKKSFTNQINLTNQSDERNRECQLVNIHIVNPNPCANFVTTQLTCPPRRQKRLVAKVVIHFKTKCIFKSNLETYQTKRKLNNHKQIYKIICFLNNYSFTHNCKKVRKDTQNCTIACISKMLMTV